MNHQEYKISGVSVLFPCKPYPSQFSMMDKILKGIERCQNCLLESPTGSGKSLALLCSSLAWQAAEKAKKDKEDTQEFEKAKCSCECQKQPEALDPPLATTNVPHASEGKSEGERCDSKSGSKFELPAFVLESKNDGDDDYNDDDFKMDEKNLHLPSKKKGSRSHISISYMDDTSQREAKNSCSLCECEASSSEGKVKTKVPKIYFGTRTHKQVAQIVRELRKTAYSDCKMTILGSREHTCIHPQVSKMKNKNDGCKELLNVRCL
ncbi:fanconi anemia group j protein [Plakobranchus ocellatus]|uniref:Fanconi anemia group j protein n=1 Tax=Plakobranchus ocellatus TaxID=259542 RepID=A0AAV4B3L3_9GAST|nr:fanconi anemia group j protein [Plakobranchus ocellatus]